MFLSDCYALRTCRCLEERLLVVKEDAKCILEALSQSLNISIVRLKDWCVDTGRVQGL